MNIPWKCLTSVLIFIAICLTITATVMVAKDPNKFNSVMGGRQSQMVLASGCGFGTILKDGECVPDDTYIAQQMINHTDFITIKNHQAVLEIGKDKIEHEALPEWYVTWLEDERGFQCNRLIDLGICNIDGNNCHAPCRCADCAGWRGGNSTTCNTKDIPGDSGRVRCNQKPGFDYALSYSQGEYDKCECEEGYCAVNGLCVAPFERKDNCCPGCINLPPNVTGGCDGTLKCDKSKTCEPNVVVPPGQQYQCEEGSFQIVENVCEPGTTPGLDNECVDVNGGDARFAQPYILIKQAENPICNEVKSTVGFGLNEYECAVNCGNDYIDSTGTVVPKVDSQLECSKRCLPKIWRWFPVFEIASDLERSFKGYHQSDTLVQYAPDTVNLKYCPGGKCEYDQKYGNYTIFEDCTDCTECTYHFENLDFSESSDYYQCKKCGNCKPPLKQLGDLGKFEDVRCNNMTGCRNCVEVIQPGGGVFPDKSLNKCSGCENWEGLSDGCVIYTTNPYIFEDGTWKFRPGVESYNRGYSYDPSKESHGSFCGDNLNSCDNTVDGKVGFGDGEYDEVANCTKNCPESELTY